MTSEDDATVEPVSGLKEMWGKLTAWKDSPVLNAINWIRKRWAGYLVRERMWRDAVSVGKLAVPLLIAALEIEVPSQKKNIVWALASIGTPAIPALLEAFQNGDKEMRRYTARAIVEIAKNEGTIAFERAIGGIGVESHVDKQVICLFALGKADEIAKVGKEAVPALVACLDGSRKSDAAMLLWRLGDVSAILADLKKVEGREQAVDLLVKIAENSEVDLREIERTLKGRVDSARKYGIDEERNAKEDAVRDYRMIAQAVARRKAGLQKEEGVILEGETVRPPSEKKGMYRTSKNGLKARNKTY